MSIWCRAVVCGFGDVVWCRIGVGLVSGVRGVSDWCWIGVGLVSISVVLLWDWCRIGVWVLVCVNWCRNGVSLVSDWGLGVCDASFGLARGGILVTGWCRIGVRGSSGVKFISN